MFLFRFWIELDPRQRTQVLQSLIRVLEPTRALAGCVSCQLCSDVEEENVVVFVEEWRTQENLEARFRDDNLRIVLAALDHSTKLPRVRIDTISETKGMELIAACRSGQASI